MQSRPNARRNRRPVWGILALASACAAGCNSPRISTAGGPTQQTPATDALVVAGPVKVNPDELTAGVTVRIYELNEPLDKLPVLIENQTPNVDQLQTDLNLPDRGAFAGTPANLYTTVGGYLKIDQPGDYVFRLDSDDGSRLMVGPDVVIDNDGRRTKSGAAVSKSVTLGVGLHPLLIEHFDGGGRCFLKLDWKLPGADAFAAIPTDALRTANDPTRVTSPGYKRVMNGRRPGDGRPLESVHPGYDVESIVAADFDPKVGAMSFLPDGRLVVGTFSPLQRDGTSLPDIESKTPDKLYAFSNLTGDLSKVTVKPVADNVFEPTGLCVVDGVLYVAHRKLVTRLLDRDGDGFFETHEDVGGGWEGWNYHQFAFGLLHRDGKLYTALSTAMAPPGWEGMGNNSAPNGPLRGSIMEIDLSSNDTRVIAGGTRTPNGLGFGPEGAMFYLDNQGTWMPTSQLAEVIPGRFYGHHNRTKFVPKLADRYPDGGHPSALSDRPRTPAAVYLPQGEISNSPTQPLLIEKGPFAGQMFVGELTGGGVRRVALEKINGQWQGAVFHFTQGLSCGVNRMAWGPDGDLYVGGIGALGNWNWKGTRSGLQRLKANGKEVFELFDMKATADGFIVRFTQPVDEKWLENVANYELATWHYKPTSDYGGPKVDERKLTVRRATPLENGRGVRLDIDGLETGNVVHLRTDPENSRGEKLWATEAWYTLNQLPAAKPAEAATIAGQPIDMTSGLGVGILPPGDAVPLITASADANFKRGKNAKDVPARTDDDLLKLPGYVEAGGGDLTSNAHFGDARYHIEFYCPPGGSGQLAANSGIYLQDLYELQVLGTLKDAQPKNNELGSIYQQKAPDLNASTGPGTWQAYDIWFRAARFDGKKKLESARATIYLNGQLIHRDVEITTPTGSKAKAGEPGGNPVQVGPLVLQDHETKAEGPVRFRNVWVAPLTPVHYTEGEWKNLLVDNKLDNWLVRGGDATYSVETGPPPAATQPSTVPATTPTTAPATSPADLLPRIVGSAVPNTPNTFLVTKETYRDFELILETKQHPELNSGVQIRSHVTGGLDQRAGKLFGYQVELDPTDRAYSGGVYDESRRGWLQALIDAPAARRAYKRDDWNTLRIVARGPVIQTWLNGTPAATVFDAVDADGHIALQVHDVGKNTEPMTVQWRNVRIRELTPSAAAK